MEEVKSAVLSTLHDLGLSTESIVLSRPDPQFGDFATNVAMQLAKQAGKNPREIAEEICARLAQKGFEASVAGPGFINIRISDAALSALVMKASQLPQPMAGKVVVAEYSDPNPFKVLHAGHLYTSVVGDAVANVIEASGGEVHRVNFGGDVGLHVGKTMWAILGELGGEHPEKLAAIDEAQRSEWMAAAYVKGTLAYEDDEAAKSIIVELNKRIYAISNTADHESPLAQIYWTCRQWSYDYFNAFYARIGTTFERYYPESEVAGLGLQTVKDQLAKGVFKESNGAVVFDGEAHGLHTRVFINSEGIPTYEAKDVGLIMQKKADYNFDTSLVITGNEQEQYMSVVLKAVEQFAPELTRATKHLTHGLVKLAGGVKMSSRKGNILRAVDVLESAAEANRAATGKDDDEVVLGAIKYSFLKSRIGGDIIYDPKESVSIEGNSGPYLQYAFARACSIMKKAEGHEGRQGTDFTPFERTLAVKISEFPEVIGVVLQEFMPHHICTYLYELTQVFNRFYENEHVIGDEREAQRLALLATYRDVLKTGLGLLGIQAPEQM
jgi:arginyl-tRNA synthetase